MERRRGSILSGLAPALASHGPELAWILARAFGPAGRALPSPAPERTAELALRLGLAARVAARTPRLDAELGPDAARRLTFQRLQTAATGRELVAAMGRVAELAGAHAIPIAWLKFAALSSRGLILEGAREARDVDVLVPLSRIEELHAALVERGMQRLPGEAEHHLPALRLASGAVVELHARLWGVDLGGVGARGAGFAELSTHGALREVSPGIHIPEDWLLAAHALVHGLVQHRGTPQDYAPLRALCDAVDLRLWALPLDRVQRAIGQFLRRTELHSMSELAQGLAGGLSLGELAPTRAGALLAALLAASLDLRYQRALVLEHALDLLHAGGLRAAIERTLGASSLSATAVAPAARWTRVGRSLQRGIELAQGAAAYAQLRWSRSR